MDLLPLESLLYGKATGAALLNRTCDDAIKSYIHAGKCVAYMDAYYMVRALRTTEATVIELPAYNVLQITQRSVVNP